MDLSKLSDTELAALEAKLSGNQTTPQQGYAITGNPIIDAAIRTAKYGAQTVIPGSDIGRDMIKNVMANGPEAGIIPAAAKTINTSQGPTGAALDAVAATGKFANSGNQQLAGIMREKNGRAGAVAGGVLSALSNALMPQSRVGALASLALAPQIEGTGNAAMEGAGAAAKKTISQGMRVTSGIAEDAGKTLLENPVKVLMADTTEVAGQKIAQAAGRHGVKAGMDGFAEVFGSEFHPGPEEMVSQFKKDWPTADALATQLKSGEITPQQALSNIQAINHNLMIPKYKNPLNSQQMSILLDRKNQLSDFLRQMGKGDVLDALEGYRFAKVKQAFMSALPQNATGGTSVLRSLMGGGAAYESSRRGASPGNALGIGAMVASPIAQLGLGAGASLMGSALGPMAGMAGKIGAMGLTNAVAGGQNGNQ